MCWVYLLHDKSEVATMFENFYTMISTQYDSKIQFLRTDNGTEYFNETLNNFLLKKGMLYQSSCVNTPQQNGVSDRKNRRLLEIARSLLFASNVPKRFWGDTLLTACFLINRMPSMVLQFRTPLQTLQKYFLENRIFSLNLICVFFDVLPLYIYTILLLANWMQGRVNVFFLDIFRFKKVIGVIRLRKENILFLKMLLLLKYFLFQTKSK